MTHKTRDDKKIYLRFVLPTHLVAGIKVSKEAKLSDVPKMLCRRNPDLENENFNIYVLDRPLDKKKTIKKTLKFLTHNHYYPYFLYLVPKNDINVYSKRKYKFAFLTKKGDYKKKHISFVDKATIQHVKDVLSKSYKHIFGCPIFNLNLLVINKNLSRHKVILNDDQIPLHYLGISLKSKIFVVPELQIKAEIYKNKNDESPINTMKIPYSNENTISNLKRYFILQIGPNFDVFICHPKKKPKLLNNTNILYKERFFKKDYLKVIQLEGKKVLTPKTLYWNIKAYQFFFLYLTSSMKKPYPLRFSNMISFVNLEEVKKALFKDLHALDLATPQNTQKMIIVEKGTGKPIEENIKPGIPDFYSIQIKFMIKFEILKDGYLFEKEFINYPNIGYIQKNILGDITAHNQSFSRFRLLNKNKEILHASAVYYDENETKYFIEILDKNPDDAVYFQFSDSSLLQNGTFEINPIDKYSSIDEAKIKIINKFDLLKINNPEEEDTEDEKFLKRQIDLIHQGKILRNGFLIKDFCSNTTQDSPIIIFLHRSLDYYLERAIK